MRVGAACKSKDDDVDLVDDTCVFQRKSERLCLGKHDLLIDGKYQ